MKEICIVIVDDEPDILDLLTQELSEKDERFNIFSSTSGYEALNILRNNKIDILITDIAMPDMDGYELYKRTKELFQDMPIIMMTGFGYDPKHVMVNAKKSGLREVILKPFETEILYEKIIRELNTSASEGE